jgi:RNase P subunit RPR2
MIHPTDETAVSVEPPNLAPLTLQAIVEIVEALLIPDAPSQETEPWRRLVQTRVSEVGANRLAARTQATMGEAMAQRTVPLSRTFTAGVLLGAALIFGSIIVSSLLIRDNQAAQVLFNVLLAFVTTLISVYATQVYSKATAQDELTRYGLQAWRNLDSLAIKLTKQIRTAATSTANLEEWLLDVDQAKWAWRDLLREIFQLQTRLETETEEIANRYKAQLTQAASPEQRSKLELERNIEITKKALQAPLPIRLPVDVTCPNCETRLIAPLGTTPGDTAWVNCSNPKCQHRFPVHRMPGGDIKVGQTKRKTLISPHCPGCPQAIGLRVPIETSVEFVTKCPNCGTHIRFAGSATKYELKDLGKQNAEFRCPYGDHNSQIWIAPGRSVSFTAACQTCGGLVTIQGELREFRVVKEQEAA